MSAGRSFTAHLGAAVEPHDADPPHVDSEDDEDLHAAMEWTDEFQNRLLVDEGNSALHDLALLAAEPMNLDNSSSIHKRKNHALAIGQPTGPAVQGTPLTSTKRTKTLSTARRNWNSLLSERTKARQTLEDLQSQLEKLQESIQSNKQRVEQTEASVCSTIPELFQDLIREDTTWYGLYKQLLEFKERYGNVSVPRTDPKRIREFGEDTVRLSRWVGMNRCLYRKKTLEEYKIYALEQLGFDWDPSGTRWMSKFKLLQEFKRKHGHAKVPYSKSSDENDNGLVAWVKRCQYQYKLYQEGKPSNLNAEKIQMLDDMGMVWKRRADSWNDRFQDLVAFKEKHGHLNVSPELDNSLSDWVRHQRTHWKKYLADPTQSILTLEQVTQLESIGLELNLRSSKWQQRLEELREFKRVHGHTMVPYKYPNNQQLSSWCTTQRRFYTRLKNGKSSLLTHERVEELKELGFEFESSQDQGSKYQITNTWEENIAELKQFKAEKGHLNVRSNTELGKWVERQRMALTEENSLTKEERDQLQELGLSNSPYAGKSWEVSFGELLAYHIRTKSYQTSSAESHLKHWIEDQRNEYQKFKLGLSSTMTQDRVARLQRAKFPFKTPGKLLITKSWDEWYVELLLFRLQNKNFNVPLGPLRDWIEKQRKMHRDFHSTGCAPTGKAGILRERIERLEKVEFPWTSSRPSPSSFPQNDTNNPRASRVLVYQTPMQMAQMPVQTPMQGAQIPMQPYRPPPPPLPSTKKHAAAELPPTMQMETAQDGHEPTMQEPKLSFVPMPVTTYPIPEEPSTTNVPTKPSGTAQTETPPTSPVRNGRIVADLAEPSPATPQGIQDSPPPLSMGTYQDPLSPPTQQQQQHNIHYSLPPFLYPPSYTPDPPPIMPYTEALANKPSAVEDAKEGSNNEDET